METTKLMDKFLERDNLNLAYLQVKRNKGSYGIDIITVNELLLYLKEYGNESIQRIREGKHNPNT